MSSSARVKRPRLAISLPASGFSDASGVNNTNWGTHNATNSFHLGGGSHLQSGLNAASDLLAVVARPRLVAHEVFSTTRL